MDALLEGQIAYDDPSAARHLDQCLGCRGCESACPSGVPYGALIEETRARMAKARPLPLVARLVLAIFAHELFLRPALLFARAVRASGLAGLAARWLPARFAMPAAMLASTARPPSTASQPIGAKRSAAFQRRTVAPLTGCVMEGLLAPVNRATERVLVRNGYELRAARTQVCCGALHAHAGDRDRARALARANIAAFDETGAEYVATNSAGCGAMLKEYGHLLADDKAWAVRAAAFSSRVRDVHELLAAAGPEPAPGVMDGSAPPQASRETTPSRVAWDAPCHLQHAQRVVEPPLQVLRAVGGIELRPLEGSDQCCGSAGIFNLTQPEVAAAVLAPKLSQIEASGAAVVATANPGCLMQIGGGLRLARSPVVARHPVELLDAAYAAELPTH